MSQTNLIIEHIKLLTTRKLFFSGSINVTFLKCDDVGRILPHQLHFSGIHFNEK